MHSKCETVAGLELTKVSVVDEELQVIYDTLVKPPNPIINYLTRYSGITEEKLQGVTKTLREVQEDLVQLIPEDTILVGHSFENDLTALKVMTL
jgi:RNA exonuclease 1